MTLPPHPYLLTRTVSIGAPPDVVFRFFTDSDRWAAWWGAGSTIDPRVGGVVRILNPGGVEVTGEVVEIVPPHHLVFTYGFTSGVPIAPGRSTVTVLLEPDGDATRLALTHAFDEPAARDAHVQGWRYQLAVLGNVVANEVHAGVAATVDAWFSAWSEPDADVREAQLDRLARADLRFRDRFSLIDGLDDLRPHLAAVHRFMPGMKLTRDGQIRHCQGTVLADWIARSTDGQERGRGTNVFVFDGAGRIATVTGFWTDSRS
jgi:uncharacterized protein YndB with AHSA1/START domain